MLKLVQAGSSPEPANESNQEPDQVKRLLKVLSETVWARQKHHHRTGWEAVMCQLVLKLDPSIRLVQISEAVPYGTQVMDRIGLMNTMANLGFTARTIATRLDQIDPRLMPCLFIPDSAPSSPAVVTEKGRLYLGQRQAWKRINGRKRMPGTAIIFQRQDAAVDEMSKFTRGGTGFSWFRAMMTRFHGTVGQIMLTGLVLNIISLTTPLFIMMVYDRVISSHAANVLLYLGIGAAISIVAEAALRYTRSKSLSWLGGRLDNIVSNWIFEHLLNLAPSYVERASIPSQIARIKTFESIRDFFSGAAFLSVLELPFMLIALGVIGAIAGPLVIVPIVMSLAYLALFFLVWRKVRVAIRIAAKASSARQQFALETFEKLEAVRANGLGGVWSEKYRDLSGREAAAQFHLGWLGMIGETFANALTVISAVVIVTTGVHLIWAGQMTSGALVASMILIWRVLGPFYSLCTMVPRIEQLRNSVRQVNTLMDIDTEETVARGLARLNRISGDVTFSGVALRYAPTDDPVFSGLNLNAPRGSVVGVTGENGSGKTSILKLIKGLYQVQGGSIRLDGMDIRQLNPHDVRRDIAYIPQSHDFFNGTIAENLRFGNPFATDSEIQQALSHARVLEDVVALPNGLQTVIGGHNGIELSSILALRLSMVRAWLHDAPVLLIDEMPNSLLNDDSRRFLRETILRRQGQQTVFIVTYREDFLDMADQIVFLRRGMQPIVEKTPVLLERLKNNQW